MISRLWWLLILQVPILALPTDTENVFADDLTSEYAKQIITAAKVAGIKGMMKPEVAPCDNFFEYACGNWNHQNPALLLERPMTDTFQLLSDGFNRRLQRLLRSQTLQSELEKKIQRFFLSCSIANRDDVLYKVALENVYREFGEMPAVVGAQWNSSAFNWWRTEAQIHQKYAKGLIFGVEIMHDIRNTSINRVYLSSPDRPGAGLKDSPLFKILEEASIAKDLQNYLGVGAKEANDIAKNLYIFEGKLFEGDSSISFEDGHSFYSMAELEEKYISYLNFTEYFGLIFGEGNIPEKLYVYNDEFLDNALALIKNTPSATQANYILWHLLEEYLVDSNDKDLSKWCVGQTKKYFGQLTDHLVYKRYRSSKAEEEVLSVWEEIRGIFREHLKGDKLDWITNATRQLAIKKLDSMELNISSYDSVDFDKLFGPVEIDIHNYVANIQHLLSAKAMETVEKLKIPGSSIDAPETLSFTPAYNIQENSITIPVALLQPRYFWSAEYPEALKYATLGYLIGHEMVHGFDDSGRSFDASGNLAPWWDIKSRYEFEERRKCFQAQYHAYKYGGSKLPETENQAENIADNAGVKFAYIAYEKWLGQQTEERKEREIMKGLDLNSRQLFFLGYAQLWCDDVHKLIRSTLAKNDEHAPSRYRVIGSLSNFQEFSWVYNCSQEAPMDPEYKCAIY
ncbi:uncharacterized protein Dana_GF17991 [Drosophila ananassae]|uniref:Uncharacterized protein n=1 Tax=Drosophila ananassae TaxID=7217 RepID=B3M347_DROAN|nr:endothelin-converting enzyme 1 [Drosophila ananassae]EDV42447.1 uncharacterized protein Dana_GF17991 [Drosophila ananassae]